MDYSSYRHLLIEIDNGVAKVTINRPEVYNAVNHRLHGELAEIWRDLGRDPDVRAIVVTGAGDKAFSAGGDLAMLGHRMALPSEKRFKETVTWEPRELVYNMVNCDKIIISAINGVAVGAGLAVALIADISIMAEDAKIGDGHTRLGVVAGDHAAMIWPLLCGIAKTKYYLLTCEFIEGREAERIGLVSKVMPRPEVVPAAMKLARQFADGSAYALGMTKRSINQWLRLGGLTSFDYSLALEKMAFFSEDAQAGVKAAREKTAPVFSSQRAAKSTDG
ncbi:MAG: enoyl-CoA hydratase/isomerase family protein [Betaproteobacteria bacterium]|nr:enoyl-CoA hydratase/isomerase family protein [Betaproteobacteria bacterium]